MMTRVFLFPLLLSLAAAGCRSSRPALSSQQAQIAADSAAVIDDYLARNTGMSGFGGKVFCAHEVLDVEDRGERVTEYVVAICQEYNGRSGHLSAGTGTGGPVVIQTERRGQTYQVVAHLVPGDSPRYAGDVKRLFPAKTHDEIFYGDRKALIEAVEKKAKAYYDTQ